MNVSKIALMVLVGTVAFSYAAVHERQLARIEDRLDPLGTQDEMALFIRHNEPATIDNILRKRNIVQNGQAHLNSEEQISHALSWFADFQDALNKERPSDRNNAREQRKRLTKAKIATRLPVAFAATTALLARYGNAHRDPKMINLAYLSGGLTALTGCRAAIKWYNASDSTIMRDANSYNQKLDAINHFIDATRSLVRLRHAQLDQTRSAAVLARVESEERLAAGQRLFAQGQAAQNQILADGLAKQSAMLAKALGVHSPARLVINDESEDDQAVSPFASVILDPRGASAESPKLGRSPVHAPTVSSASSSNPPSLPF